MADTSSLYWLAEQGAVFVPVYPRDKRPIGASWQTRPHTLEQILPEVEQGNNAGLLCGEPSDLLGLWDIDRNFAKFLQKFPKYRNTPRIVRPDAPDKAKLLIRVSAPVGNAKWAPVPVEGPLSEWLFTGNQGVVPPSIHPDGAAYELEHASEPIPVLTPEELDRDWYKWTREHLIEHPRGTRSPRRSSYTPDPDAERVKEEIRAGFDLVRYAEQVTGSKSQQESSGEIRILGQGGLLIDPRRGVWNSFEDGEGKVGGDCFALVAHLEYGDPDASGDRWPVVLEKAAAFVGIPLEFRTNGHHPELANESSDEAPGVDLLQFEASDEGNAETVAAVHGERFRHVKEWGWLHWTGTHWTDEGAEAALGFAVVNTLRNRRAAAVHGEIEAVVKCSKPNRARVSACIAMLEKHLEAMTGDFDQDPHLLNVANGVIDLRTGQLLEHAERQRFTYCVPIAYDPGADTQEWEDFLQQVVGGGQSVIDYLQEATGYSLSGDTREECLFYIYGPTRSGKGTFTETLLALLGKPLAAEVDFNQFAQQRGNPDAQNFALAPLKPCRAIFASESGRYQQLNEAKIKLLTGGNDVYCAHKGKPHFSYRPQFKMWLSSNERPKGDVDDDALWYRIKVVEFPRSHAGKEDKTLKWRLRDKRNLQGVLTWAVEGARRWYSRRQGLQHPAAVVLATQKSREELDTVQQWLDECCERAEDAFAPNSRIRISYENWCTVNGHKPLGARNLGRALSKKGFEPSKGSAGGSRVRGMSNLEVIVTDGRLDQGKPERREALEDTF